MSDFIVTEAAIAPVNDGARFCTWCRQPVGSRHCADCVCISKTVKVRAVIEYEVSVPAHWNQIDIEFHRNDGSWCANNMIDELDALGEVSGCLCPHVEFAYLGDVSGPYLDEPKRTSAAQESDGVSDASPTVK